MKIFILILLLLSINTVTQARSPNPFPIYEQAKKVDPEAMYTVAQWESDPASMKKWLEKATLKGHKNAHLLLAWLHRCKRYYNVYGLDHQYYQNLDHKHKQYILMISPKRSEIYAEDIIYDPLLCFNFGDKTINLN